MRESKWANFVKFNFADEQLSDKNKNLTCENVLNCSPADSKFISQFTNSKRIRAPKIEIDKRYD